MTIFTPKALAGKRIIGLSFPGNGSMQVGLEPGILNVLPPGDNVEFSPRTQKFNDSTVGMYMCSVYIAGRREFKEWAMEHDTSKIVVGSYDPTMFPEEYLNFAAKIVMGPCNDIWATLSQEDVVFQRAFFNPTDDFQLAFNPQTLEPIKDPKALKELLADKKRRPNNSRFKKGKFVSDVKPGREYVNDRIIPGVLDPAYPYLPRYDLYNVNNNAQVIPDMQSGQIVTSVNTSFGCIYNCSFCCTPLMFDALVSKPLGSLAREVALLKALRPSFLFIKDENPTLLPDFEERIKIIATPGAKIYMFSPANKLTKEVADIMKKNNVYMVCLGLEDPRVTYEKNENLGGAIELLKERGIYTYLSYIVNPLDVVGAEEGQAFYTLLMNKLRLYKPEMICGNFLMPFPGTREWDKYYQLISERDFIHYDSKTPFLIKNEVARKKMEYYLFWYQWLYYTSDFYKNEVREFEVGDTLHKRFVELKEHFDRVMSGIVGVRP